MRIKEINGNLFDSEADVLCHQVNTYGVMGAGIAAEVKERFPEVYTEYNAYCATKAEPELLGDVLISKAEERYIANCFSQCGMKTVYEAFEACMRKVRHYAEQNGGKTIGIPRGMGCGIAGGDWNIVEKIIRAVFDNSDLNVEIWKLV